MKLERYRQKRHFQQTPEPKGKESKTHSNLFVVQKHAASHLHYDFRLEIDGVLKSWAIPKGPSLDPSVKRLAVQVEDHPIEYGDFEGVIPKGQYGGGTVMVWDKGVWNLIEQKKQDAGITFSLEGEKLKGKWKLIHFKNQPKNWLLIKAKDSEACAEEDYSITEEEPLSVLTGRDIEQITLDGDKTWQSKKKITTSKKSTLKKAHLKLDQLHLKKTPFKSEFHPQLATLVDKPPTTNEWLHEIKFDGYRLLAVIKNKIQMITRGQKDWTEKFPDIVKALKGLHLSGTVLDGEVVALDENGQSNFQLLQNTLHEGSNQPLIYYVFDLPFYQGYDLSSLELIQRKEILRQILPVQEEGLIRFSDHIIGHGTEVFHKACELNLEGIVSKNIHSHYAQKRTKSWLKVKCIQRQEFVIGGITQPRGGRDYFGSLLLGYYSDQQFYYCGHVGTGFTQRSLKELYQIIQPYQTDSSPFVNSLPKTNVLSWVKPKIVVEVEFTEWTSDGILRHPSFKGVREDKAAKAVTREKARNSPVLEATTMPDLPISSPNKILYPEDGFTKLDLAKYYYDICDWILPYIVERPLTLVRCPEGIGQSCFFQRHLNESDRKQGLLCPVIVTNEKGNKEYLYIQDQAGLMALVQKGVLEIHTWGSRIDKLHYPDMIVFDLDPAPHLEWSAVIKAAFQIKKELENLELASFVKTSGGKGLHLVIPIMRRYSWEQILIFSKTFARYLAAKYPNQYIDVMTKSKRTDKIFIDYVRNHLGSTSIAPYSTRARLHAPVATPLTWKELNVKITPDFFTLQNVRQRLDALKDDPWAKFWHLKQKLPQIE